MSNLMALNHRLQCRHNGLCIEAVFLEGSIGAVFHLHMLLISTVYGLIVYDFIRRSSERRLLFYVGCCSIAIAEFKSLLDLNVQHGRHKFY